MKRLLFFGLVMALLGGNVYAYDFSAVSPSGDTLYYTIKSDGNSVKVVKPTDYDYNWNEFTEPSGNLIIPELVSYMGITYPVTEIGNLAFYNCQDITSVSIPSSVTYIEYRAFYQCNSMISVTFPDSLIYIGTFAFARCSSLTSISIPNSVHLISDGAFWNCTSLTSVTIPSPVTYINIYGSPFEDCNNITYLNYNTDAFNPTNIPHDNLQTVVIGDSVTSIPANAFLNATNLSHVTIGSGVTSIGGYAFCLCSSLNTIVALPDNAPSLGTDVFYGTPDTKYVILNCGADYASVWGTTGFIYSNGYILALESNNALYGTASFVQPVDCQQTAIIQATPASRCVFTGWSDGNTDNPRTITLTGNTTLTANFALTREVVVQSANEVMGTTEGGGIHRVGSEVTLSAIATCGFRFTHWQDGEVSNPRTITLGADTVFTAYFELHSDTVFLHDTSYVDVHDTTYIDVHDTAYVDVYVHDTTYINVPVHDTTVVTDTVTLTEYVQVHDTTYINIPVHDTTVVTDTVTLTEYVTVHDTTYINVPVHDTTVVTDTVTLTEYVSVHDTTFVNIHDTTYIIQTDTVTNTIYDTITNIVFDTITNTVFDTTVVFSTDTLWLHDTVFVYDTIYIHDTIVVGVDEVDAINAKIYTNRGQIVVDGAESNTVCLYDINGRILATKQDECSPLRFDVPITGTYLVKVGNHPARKVVVIR